MKKNLWILFIFFVTYNISFADNLKIVDGDTIILNDEKNVLIMLFWVQPLILV